MQYCLGGINFFLYKVARSKNSTALVQCKQVSYISLPVFACAFCLVLKKHCTAVAVNFTSKNKTNIHVFEFQMIFTAEALCCKAKIQFSTSQTGLSASLMLLL